MFAKVAVVCLFVGVFVEHASGHGRLLDPPGRSSMWRYGYPTEPNYTDNGLNCGGATVQHTTNNHMCGICGDNFSDNAPRANEDGGIYGQKIVTNTYKMGSQMPVFVELTASHIGTFEFGLCDVSKTKETEDCFKPLKLIDGSSKFVVPNFDKANYTMALQLPNDVSCSRCVLRWHYRAGNSQGQCADGSWSSDCADQETFRNCADIAIN